MGDKEHYNPAGVLEWVIALIFILYVLSYIIDFLPAVHSKHDRFPAIEKGAHEGVGTNNMGGPVYTSGGHEDSTAASNSSRQPITPLQDTGRVGHTNDGTYLNYDNVPAQGTVPASRNF